MRIRWFVARVALALMVAITSCLVSAGVTSSTLAQGGQSAQPKVSPDEQKLAEGIMAALDSAAKLKAAAEFIQKYPRSSLRGRVAQGMADEINGVAEASQKLSLAQNYQTIFNETSERELAVRLLINAYGAAQRSEEAFTAGSQFLAKNPDSVRVLVMLMLMGADQAKLKNTKFVEQSIQYGSKAIELLEANKKPADMDDVSWQHYKAVLPGMYQSMGVLNLLKGNLAEAKIRLTKAVEMAPLDPFNYLFFSSALNEEYQSGAKRYLAMPDGPAKADELQKVLSSLDRVIDAYAHMLALSEGNDRLQPVRQQYLQDLESYYKYRHNNSTEGMQQLIDKYKVPAK
jgi:hypothetical protein